MFLLLRSGSYFLICCLLACAALGCGGLEGNEQFQTQVSRIDRIDEELKTAQRDMGRINNEYTSMSSQYDAITKELKGGKTPAGAPVAGGAGDSLKILEQRVKALEDQIKTLQGSGGSGTAPSGKSNIAKRGGAQPNAQPSAQPSAEPQGEPAAPAPAAESKPKGKAAKAMGERATVASKGGGGSRAAVVPKTTAATSSGKRGSRKSGAGINGTVQNEPAGGAGSSVPTTLVASNSAGSAGEARSSGASSGGGFYYTVGADDSVAVIADRNHVTPGAILKANNLPAKFVLHQGQQLYIPHK